MSRHRSRQRRIAPWITIKVMLFSCAPASNCTTNRDCQASLGVGHVCESGLCEPADINPRCETTFPSDLFDRPDLNEMHVVGSIMDRSVSLFQTWEDAFALAFVQASTEGLNKADDLGIIFCTNEIAIQDGAEDFGDGLENNGDAAAAMAEHLVDEIGVQAIFGPVRSGSAVRVYNEVVAPNNVLLVSPSATDPMLTDLDPAPGMLWRTVAPDNMQAKAIAYDMRVERDPPVENVAVVYEDSSSGNGIFDTFAAEFRAWGGAEILPFIYAANQLGALDAAIQSAGEANASEILFVTSDQDYVIQFKTLTALLPAYNGKGIFVTQVATASEALLGGSPDRIAQMRGVRPDYIAPDSDTLLRFFAEFEARYGTFLTSDAVFAANAYDAGWLLVYALVWAALNEGEVTGDNLAKGLRQLGAGIELEVGLPDWNTAKALLAGGESIDIAGASGSLDFNASEELECRVEVWRQTDDHSDTIDILYKWDPEDPVYNP